MSVFSLQRYTMHNYKHRHVPSGLYVNDFNQFNKNNIKMSLLRQKHIDSTIKEKKERQSKLHMPKMLYSNVFLDNIETHPMNCNEFYGVDVCGGNNTTTNAMNKDKMKKRRGNDDGGRKRNTLGKGNGLLDRQRRN